MSVRYLSGKTLKRIAAVTVVFALLITLPAVAANGAISSSLTINYNFAGDTNIVKTEQLQLTSSSDSENLLTGSFTLPETLGEDADHYIYQYSWSTEVDETQGYESVNYTHSVLSGLPGESDVVTADLGNLNEPSTANGANLGSVSIHAHLYERNVVKLNYMSDDQLLETESLKQSASGQTVYNFTVTSSVPTSDAGAFYGWREDEEPDVFYRAGDTFAASEDSLSWVSGEWYTDSQDHNTGIVTLSAAYGHTEKQYMWTMRAMQ
ncbi:MAG: hypothetical protein K6F37_03590 [Lachnospiraceae bacterium]|nr:hypothetical protein [Lachnospiraceae bacterium]